MLFSNVEFVLRGLGFLLYNSVANRHIKYDAIVVFYIFLATLVTGNLERV